MKKQLRPIVIIMIMVKQKTKHSALFFADKQWGKLPNILTQKSEATE